MEDASRADGPGGRGGFFRQTVVYVLIGLIGMMTYVLGMTIPLRYMVLWGIETVKTVDLRSHTNRWFIPSLMVAESVRTILEILLLAVPAYAYFGNQLKSIFSKWYSFLILLVYVFGYRQVGFYSFYPAFNSADLALICFRETLFTLIVWFLTWTIIYVKFRSDGRPHHPASLACLPKGEDTATALAQITEHQKIRKSRIFILASLIILCGYNAVAVSLAHTKTFVVAEMFTFIFSLPILYGLYAESKRPHPTTYDWLYLCVFTSISFAISLVPVMIVSLMAGMGSWTVFGILIGYHVVMQYLHLGMRKMAEFMTSIQEHVQFRLLTQIFDDFYADLVFVFIDYFSVSYFFILAFQFIRILLRDGGMWRYFARKELWRGICRKTAVAPSAKDYELKKVHSSDQATAQQLDSSEANKEEEPTQSTPQDPMVLGERVNVQVMERRSAFAVQKFISEMVSTVGIPWMIYLENDLLPDKDGCRVTCNALNNANFSLVVTSYAVLLATKILAYFAVFWVLRRKWKGAMAAHNLHGKMRRWNTMQQMSTTIKEYLVRCAPYYLVCATYCLMILMGPTHLTNLIFPFSPVVGTVRFCFLFYEVLASQLEFVANFVNDPRDAPYQTPPRSHAHGLSPAQHQTLQHSGPFSFHALLDHQ